MIVGAVLDVIALGLVGWSWSLLRRARVDYRRARRANAAALADADYWRGIALALVTPAELYEVETAVPSRDLFGRPVGGVVESPAATFARLVADELGPEGGADR